MRAALVVSAAILVAGCPPPQQQRAPGPPTPVQPEPPPPDDAQSPGEPGDGALAAEGEPCLAGSDCESGICEGQGCGDDEPGACVSKQRACTRDLRSYCGCDGQTFQASGSCPNRRYASRGACRDESAGAPDGSSCSSGAECASGICEGEGCGKDAGTCMSRRRPCTADRRPYCGCDGQTFYSSGTCANRLFQHRGECKQTR